IDRCDDVDWRTGLPKPASQRRSGIGHAQKIRAALTNLFGIKGNLGALQWQQDRASEQMIGNPSISPLVSRYMLGLAKRKVRLSISSEQPYIHKTSVSGGRKLDEREGNYSGKYLINENLHPRFLQACYTLAYLCLLRFDEVLQIQISDLRWITDGKGRRVELRLPFRKTTHVAGMYPTRDVALHADAHLAKIQPFVLWPMRREEAYLCPYRALCEWLHASKLREGFLFPRLSVDGRIKRTTNTQHTAESFLEHFRINLLQVGVSYSAYGTHSFRRGGCQYLITHRRWNIRRVCEWGGWSTDFTYMTIVKYIISYVDEAMSARDDFFRPDQPVTRHCTTCGRCCPCNS
ncbi:hypothetical protein EV121DRAFT_216974, partial [Schizophyllum commune]